MSLTKYKKLNIQSIFINFKVLPLKQAIHLPILISRKCKISGFCKNSISIESSYIKPGMIQIGYDCCGIIDYKCERTLVSIGKDSKIVFKGKSIIGSACRITVQNGGILEIGSGTNFTGRSDILCYKNIKFGNSCLISWNCSFMDTDFHKIKSKTDKQVMNPDKSIIIGNKVWFGAGCKILKGTVVSDNIVVGAGSLVSGKLLENNSVYAGAPAVVKKSNIEWEE